MSKDTFISNLYRAASNMISQFSTDEPLISQEAKSMLDDAEARKEIFDKILTKPTAGEVKLAFKGEDVTFFVEA